MFEELHVEIFQRNVLPRRKRYQIDTFATMKRLYVLFAVGLISSCASQSQYDWGSYSDGLYRYYQYPAEHQKIRQKLVSHIEQLEANGKIVPPGLYAEVGTYFLQAGDSATAITYYEKEHETWPESRKLMSSMIFNLEGRQNAL